MAAPSLTYLQDGKLSMYIVGLMVNYGISNTIMLEIP